VRVISLKLLREFWDHRPGAEMPLRLWHKAVLRARWTDLNDTRRTYPHADGVRTKQGELLTVFNIGGNKYRLIVRIRYDFQLVNIRHVPTHAEYSSDQWKE